MKKKIVIALMMIILIGASLAAALPPKEEPKEKPEPPNIREEAGQVLIQLNYPDTPITQLIKIISDLTGKNFVFDESLSNKSITIISPKYVTISEAYKVLLSILEIKGFSVVETDNLVKIIPIKEAKSKNIQTFTSPGESGAADNFITQLIPLKHVRAMTLQNGIRQIVSTNGVVFPYDETNTLIVIDTAANMERVLKITKELDVSGVSMVYDVLQIQYATASDIVREISTIFAGAVPRGAKATQGKGKGAAKGRRAQSSQSSRVPFKAIADDRTNSVIIFADESILEQIKDVIKKIDIDIPQGQSRIRVYYLKYANSEEIADVLAKFSYEARRRSPTSKRPKPPPPRPGAKKPPKPPAQPKEVKAGKLQIEGDVTITADKATNSLIILASPSDYDTLKAVIEKLDIMRPQVLVEAFIVEISLDKEKELGIEWRSTSDFTKDKLAVIGGTNFGTINNLTTNPLATPSGLMLGTVKGTVTFGGREFLNIGALMRALETESDINIMSRPHILTMDNEEAQITVVENIPYKISEKYDTNGNPIFSYDYKDVGVVLKLTPQVMESSYVKLKIDQEISQVVKSMRGVEATAPTTSKRTANTTVFVKDNAMVVIGGLIKDNEIQSESKVPCLGDIPFFGALFRANSVRVQKTDLLVFLTPHIIRAFGDLDDMSTEKKKELKEFKATEKFKDFKEFTDDEPAKDDNKK